TAGDASGKKTFPKVAATKPYTPKSNHSMALPKAAAVTAFLRLLLSTTVMSSMWSGLALLDAAEDCVIWLLLESRTMTCSVAHVLSIPEKKHMLDAILIRLGWHAVRPALLFDYQLKGSRNQCRLARKTARDLQPLL